RVADLDRDRAAERDAVPDAGEHGDLVLLELHPGAAAVAEPAPGQLTRYVVGGDVDAGDHAFDHGHQRAAVGFTSCGPSQHASHFRTSPADTDFGVISDAERRKSRRNRKPVQDAIYLADGLAVGGLLVVGAGDDHRGLAERAVKKVSERPRWSRCDAAGLRSL